MRFRVLGCFGGNTLDMRPTSYLINGNIAIDAGALTSALPLREQAEIRHIFLSHAHIDHLATLPFLMDNTFSLVKTPLSIYGPDHTIQCLGEHLFNNQLWPDFTVFSNDSSTILELHPIQPGETIEVEGVKLTPAAMDHTVPCFGYLVEEGGTALFISGDTRSIDGALPLLRSTASRLEMVILEASFPNRMRKIAEASRHLTPEGLWREVKKLPQGARVLVNHMKPECLGEIQQEIADLGLTNVFLIEQGAVYHLGRSRPPGGGKP